MKPYLTDDEINEICKPLTQAHAQIRYLRGLGVPVSRKPGGRPLVGRTAFDRVMAAAPPAVANDDSLPGSGPQPDHAALQQHFNKQRNHGTQTQIR
ncbi:DUF4224 domain-containing protein [Achromobacter seleniivolatilans]|uniref:DUF4224 domain-containing protein n=1 Tax=Achromobacter seleniivolatilans TaxID=3047478 RepID=A0ABY9MC24_9BURK|nr:DUF4224 domain-containing protein [Achromobacter sp. R39]WMD23342.1 DUF4224 domain-containing protein [Achromobacter sp. R39]